MDSTRLPSWWPLLVLLACLGWLACARAEAPSVDAAPLAQAGNADPYAPLVAEGEPYAKITQLLKNIDRAGPGYAVAFSPDGRTLASGGSDKTVHLWDVANGREQARLVGGHTGGVKSVAFSPDGRTLASASSDKTVRLLDVASGQETARLVGHEGKVYAVAFSPDGRTLASASDDNTVRLWDVASGLEKRQLAGHGGGVNAVAFSLDGSTLASGSNDKTVWLWDVATGQKRARLTGHKSYVNAVAFSSDGHTLASGSSDKTVRLWDLASSREQGRLAGHTGDVNAVAFSPDGRTLASAASDKTVRLWDVASGRERASLARHAESVRSVAFSPDGRTLVSGVSNDTVHLWDVASGQEKARLERRAGGLWSFASSPDGSTLALAVWDNTIRLWDVASGRETARLTGHEDTVWSLAFSPNGSILASASVDKTVRLWDVASSRELARLTGHEGGVRSVAFSPDGNTLASGSSDRTVRLWDVASGQEKLRLAGHEDGVSAVAFSPNGHTLASGSRNDSVRLWNANDGRETGRLGSGYAGSIKDIAFSPNGQMVALDTWSNTVRLWDVETGQELKRQAGHVNDVLPTAGDTLKNLKAWVLVAGSNDLWVACNDERQRCWRRDDGSLIVNVNHTGRVRRMPPPGQAQPLTATLQSPDAALIDAGEVLQVTFDIRNDGDGPAYWLSLQAAEGVAADWSIAPNILTVLAAGQSATLTARIFPHFDTHNPTPRELSIPLVLTQEHGASLKLQPIKLRVLPPLLQVIEARRLKDQGQQSITLTLENQGSALGKTAFRLLVPGLAAKQQPALQTQDAIPGGARLPLSFALPFGWQADGELKVALYAAKQFDGEGSGLPMLDWEFPDLPVAAPTTTWSLYGAALAGLLTLTAWGYYWRVYRHPVVLRLSRQPEALLALDIGELAQTRRALERAGSWEALLQVNQVHAQWLNRAEAFDRLAGFAERFAVLGERLNVKLAGTVDADTHCGVVELDEHFALNLRRVRLCLPPAEWPAADVLNRLGAPSEVTVIIGATPMQRRDLAQRAKAGNGLWVAPSGSEMTSLLLASAPLEELARLIARYVPVTQISPYQTGAGVHKAGLFFGRASLLAQIMGGNPANYLLVGGRQLGKSSLLKELERRYRHEAGVVCHYLVLSGKDAPASLAHSVGAPMERGLDGVRDYLRGMDGRRVLFLIDEADAFVEADLREGYAVLQLLRALSEEGRAHFILAGFWSLYQHAALDYQSPLKNFGSVLSVGALEREACRALAVEPMRNLGIGWASEAVLEQLIEQTGQRANLVSLACDEALQTLGNTERVIDAAHVQQALNGSRMRDALQGWAELSGLAEDDRLDRLLVYASVALPAGFTLADLIERLEAVAVHAAPEALKRSLARLELAFVLGREGNRYFYRVPLQRDLILADDVQLLLRQEARDWGEFTPEMQNKLRQATEWMKENPPMETDLDAFLAQVKDR